MYTLLKGGSGVWKKTARVYSILSVFFAIFAFVYLQFSHGESSLFLIWLFAPALLLGLIPALLMNRMRGFKRPGIFVRRVWNSAIAALSCGMLVRAIVNISGRYTEYDTIYWILSGVLFLAAIALFLRQAGKPQTGKSMAREKEM